MKWKTSEKAAEHLSVSIYFSLTRPRGWSATWSKLCGCVKGQKTTDKQKNAPTVLRVFNMQAHLQLCADGPGWILLSRLLGKEDDCYVALRPLHGKSEEGQSIAGRASHDAETWLQDTVRVGQGQVMASSLTSCQVSEQRYTTTHSLLRCLFDFIRFHSECSGKNHGKQIFSALENTLCPDFLII